MQERKPELPQQTGYLSVSCYELIRMTDMVTIVSIASSFCNCYQVWGERDLMLGQIWTQSSKSDATTSLLDPHHSVGHLAFSATALLWEVVAPTPYSHRIDGHFVFSAMTLLCSRGVRTLLCVLSRRSCAVSAVSRELRRGAGLSVWYSMWARWQNYCGFFLFVFFLRGNERVFELLDCLSVYKGSIESFITFLNKFLHDYQV